VVPLLIIIAAISLVTVAVASAVLAVVTAAVSVDIIITTTAAKRILAATRQALTVAEPLPTQRQPPQKSNSLHQSLI